MSGQQLQTLLRHLAHARDGYLLPALWLLVVVIAIVTPSLLQRLRAGWGGRR